MLEQDFLDIDQAGLMGAGFKSSVGKAADGIVIDAQKSVPAPKVDDATKGRRSNAGNSRDGL